MKASKIKKAKDPNQFVCFKMTKLSESPQKWLYYRLPRGVVDDLLNENPDEYKIVFISKGAFQAQISKIARLQAAEEKALRAKNKKKKAAEKKTKKPLKLLIPTNSRQRRRVTTLVENRARGIKSRAEWRRSKEIRVV